MKIGHCFNIKLGKASIGSAVFHSIDRKKIEYEFYSALDEVTHVS